MNIYLPVYILRSVGVVNDLFDVFPAPEDDSREATEAVLKERLRFDREETLQGIGVPDSNPSLDPSVVKYLYGPSMSRQRLYQRRFPIQMDGYEILDAFVCLGSRFGLKTLQCYVELCRGGHGYWVNVYYVADSVSPDLRIDVTRAIPSYNPDHLQRLVDDRRAKDKAYEAKMAEFEAEIEDDEA